MSDQLYTQRNNTYLLAIVYLLAGLVVSLGGLVLFGWHIKSTPLIQVHPSFVPMQYNTALCFVLSGTALLTALRNQRLFSLVLSALAATISGLTLVQYGAQINLGIDQLLMEHHVTTKTVYPGRMAPNTAFCFFLSGATIFLFSLIKHFNKILLMGPVIVGLGCMAFFGYLLGVDTNYGWEHLTRMALHTSVGFIALGSALSLWALSKFAQREKDSLNNGPVIASSILLAVLVITLSQATSNWQEKQLKNDLTNQVNNFRLTTENYINAQIETLIRMADRWRQWGGMPKNVWLADAQNYINHLSVFQTIGLVDDSFQVRGIVSVADNKFSLNNQKLHQILLETYDKKPPPISNKVSIVPRGETFLVHIPLFIDGTFDGFIIGVASVDKLFVSLAQKTQISKNLDYRVYHNNQLIFASTTPSLVNDRYKLTTALSLKNISWQTELSPTADYVSQSTSLLPLIILLGGFAAILVLLYFHNLRRREYIQSRHITALESEKRRLAEQQKKQLSRHNDVLFDTALIALLVVDKDGKITTANTEALTLFGYQKDELIGQKVEILMPHQLQSQHTAHREAYFLQPTKRKMGSGLDLFGRHRDGGLFAVDISLAPLDHDNQGNILVSIIDISDITESRRREAEYTLKLEKSNHELERSNQELNNFAYVASHDLKAPLRGIIQLASWIAEDLQDNIDEDTSKHLNLMKNRAARLEKLLDDLLAYSRIGRMHGEFKQIDITATLYNLFELLAPPPGFTLTCDDNLPEIVTLSVPLEQIFRNLINNAIKHHDRDQGHIHIHAKPTENGYQFIIEDDGPGIPFDQHERVFRIFQTLKPRDEVEGSGMGLAIIKKILDYYNSNIMIESDGQRGTRMIFTWPDEKTLRSLLDE